MVNTDKEQLSVQLGIQGRDLRLLESQLSGQTSVILCRERAIVMNMAFVKVRILSLPYMAGNCHTGCDWAAYMRWLEEGSGRHNWYHTAGRQCLASS